MSQLFDLKFKIERNTFNSLCGLNVDAISYQILCQEAYCAVGQVGLFIGACFLPFGGEQEVYAFVLLKQGLF